MLGSDEFDFNVLVDKGYYKQAATFALIMCEDYMKK